MSDVSVLALDVGFHCVHFIHYLFIFRRNRVLQRTEFRLFLHISLQRGLSVCLSSVTFVHPAKTV